MREYIVYYRERGNTKAYETRCTVTVNNKKEARENFEEWDNQQYILPLYQHREFLSRHIYLR